MYGFICGLMYLCYHQAVGSVLNSLYITELFHVGCGGIVVSISYYSLCAVIASRLNASQRSQFGVGMNRSARGVKCKVL